MLRGIYPELATASGSVVSYAIISEQGESGFLQVSPNGYLGLPLSVADSVDPKNAREEKKRQRELFYGDDNSDVVDALLRKQLGEGANFSARDDITAFDDSRCGEWNETIESQRLDWKSGVTFKIFSVGLFPYALVYNASDPGKAVAALDISDDCRDSIGLLLKNRYKEVLNKHHEGAQEHRTVADEHGFERLLKVNHDDADIETWRKAYQETQDRLKQAKGLKRDFHAPGLRAWAVDGDGNTVGAAILPQSGYDRLKNLVDKWVPNNANQLYPCLRPAFWEGAANAHQDAMLRREGNEELFDAIEQRVARVISRNVPEAERDASGEAWSHVLVCTVGKIPSTETYVIGPANELGYLPHLAVRQQDKMHGELTKAVQSNNLCVDSYPVPLKGLRFINVSQPKECSVIGTDFAYTPRRLRPVNDEYAMRLGYQTAREDAQDITDDSGFDQSEIEQMLQESRMLAHPPIQLSVTASPARFRAAHAIDPMNASVTAWISARLAFRPFTVENNASAASLQSRLSGAGSLTGSLPQESSDQPSPIAPSGPSPQFMRQWSGSDLMHFSSGSNSLEASGILDHRVSVPPSVLSDVFFFGVSGYVSRATSGQPTPFGRSRAGSNVAGFFGLGIASGSGVALSPRQNRSRGASMSLSAALQTSDSEIDDSSQGLLLTTSVVSGIRSDIRYTVGSGTSSVVAPSETPYQILPEESSVEDVALTNANLDSSRRSTEAAPLSVIPSEIPAGSFVEEAAAANVDRPSSREGAEAVSAAIDDTTYALPGRDVGRRGVRETLGLRSARDVFRLPRKAWNKVLRLGR